MKNASRFLLPLEMFTAITLLSWGFTGWIGVRDPLYIALVLAGQNREWGTWLVAIGALQLCVASLEWAIGRHWTPALLLISVRARWLLALLAAVAWLYACYFMVVTPGAGGLVPLLMQALAGCGFSIWVLVENLKAAALLDPAVPTTRLQSHILADRRKLLEGG